MGLTVSLEEARPRPVNRPARPVKSPPPRRDPAAPAFAGAVEAYLEALQAGGRSPETVRLYRTALGHFVRWVAGERPLAACANLDHALADAFARHLRTGPRTDRGVPLSDRTVHQYICVLKLFARWGARGGRYWPASPLADYQAPRFTETEIVPYTHAELAALLDAGGPPTAFMARRLRAMLLVALDTGVRRGELRRLTVPAVDLATGRVRLPAAITKTRRARTVHLQRAALEAVRAWLAARAVLPAVGPDLGPLFCGLDGAGLSDGAMDRLAARLRARSGVARFRWHLMRHTAGTESLRNGADSLDVQETLGHTSGLMTRRYLHLTDDDRRARHARFSPVEGLFGGTASREDRFRRRTDGGRAGRSG